jgi:hypothetical protein
MKYCQGPKCHEHKTKDRIRGSKGDKHYETRKRSSFYYGNDNFCDQRCMYEWFKLHGQRAVDHFGRLHEPKRTDCDSAWYKDYTWGRDGNHDHFIYNDLLGRRISITLQQYTNCNPNNITDLITTPS